jgi:hypothetical protein
VTGLIRTCLALAITTASLVDAITPSPNAGRPPLGISGTGPVFHE